jgi:hypothetical protein
MEFRLTAILDDGQIVTLSTIKTAGMSHGAHIAHSHDGNQPLIDGMSESDRCALATMLESMLMTRLPIPDNLPGLRAVKEEWQRRVKETRAP